MYSVLKNKEGQKKELLAKCTTQDLYINHALNGAIKSLSMQKVGYAEIHDRWIRLNPNAAGSYLEMMISLLAFRKPRGAQKLIY